ncbi:MAG TPA: TRAP transporter large permease [Bacillota bacterium]|nr:TRAP transporter large permease [Bacillota bacterium]
MITLVLLGSFAVLLILGIPISVSLGVSSILALLASGLGLGMIATNVFAAISKFVLLAIPFFIVAGNIMEKTGISHRLINLAQAFVGHKRGGLPIVCVIVSCFFAAISGSGPATVAALGPIIIPAMVKAGYKASHTAALIAITGAIGVIIPPSTSMVIYASITGVSVGKMFMAGIIPGILMGTLLAIEFIRETKKDNIIMLPKASNSERWISLKEALAGLMMPVIILGGIYGGIFTPTEAAAVSAVYGLLVGVFIYKNVTLKMLYKIFVDSVAQSGVIMYIIACASLFAWVINVAGIGNLVQNAIVQFADGNWIVFMIIVNVTLLIAGCFIDVVSSFYIFTPIFYPIALQMGYDPILLGIVMVMNTAIGLATPPVGANLYVACSIADVSVLDISKRILGLVIVSVIALLLVTYIPQITLFLPGLMK